MYGVFKLKKRIIYLLILIILILAGIYFFKHSESYSKPILKAKIINLPTGNFEKNTISSFYIIREVLEEKYDFQVTKGEDYDLIIDSQDGNEKIKNDKAFKIYFMGEAQKPKLEGYDLVLAFDYLEDHPNYVRFPVHYMYFPSDFLKNTLNTNYKRGECNPHKQNFACFLVSNGSAKERVRMFHRLSLYKEVLSGGAYLNNIGSRIAPDKTMQWLENCKFIIAYENNSDYPGYITEKVYRAYYSGAIPIYSSHPSAQNDINTDAVVSRQKFASDEEMVNYIIELDQNDEKYCEVWSKRLVVDPEFNYENMKKKLRKKLEKLLE